MAEIHNVLVHELVKCILGNVGFVPAPNFGKLGLSEKHFIKHHLEINDIEFPVHFGLLRQGVNKLYASASRIDFENEPELFSMCYRIDTGPIYGIRCNFRTIDDLRFISHNGKEWTDLSLDKKLFSCGGFERVMSQGMIFESCTKEETNLLDYLIDLIEM